MAKLQWETYVSIFKNKYILRGLLPAVGIPFGAIIAYIVIMAKGDVFGTDAKYALLLILLLLVLTFLLVMIVYGGKYAPGFIIDEKGIVNYTCKQQARRGRIINALTIALGLLSGNPTAVGAGMIAQTRQVVAIKWKNIRKVTYDPQALTILVQGGFGERIALFCTQPVYEEAARLIGERSGK